MRWTLRATLGISLAAHVVVATALLRPHRGAPPDLGPVVDPAPALAGETFELPAPETPDTLATAAPVEVGDAPARTTPPRRAPAAPRPSHQHSDAVPGTSGDESRYGAVGDRSAADLASAFTRGLPQAASDDPAWKTAPLGSAGEAVIVLTLDESGHVEDVKVSGTPSAALTSAIKRTMALIGGRPFTSRSRTTTLRVDATVGPDTVHDGFHGDVFAIGFDHGAAWFALPMGRRIDVRIRSR